MTSNNETQSRPLVCRVACDDPQKAQETGFSSILGCVLRVSGRLLCAAGVHRWSFPLGGAVRVCPRCLRRQAPALGDGKWRDL